jgi:hypothetical protein
MSIDTARKRLEFEAWYETIRPTAPRLLDAERATDLDRARKGAPATEVWSGKALNDLLASIQKAGSGRLSEGPRVALDEPTLKHLNLVAAGAGNGNAGILRKFADKDQNFRLNWPEALREGFYEKPGQQLEAELSAAARDVRDGQDVASDRLKTIRANHKMISDKLDASADELAPSQYIESKRFLNQLNAAIRALSDPNVKNHISANGAWRAKGKNTVAELVDHMNRTGLWFGPATEGDQAAYNAMYLALRNFEAGLQGGPR